MADEKLKSFPGLLPTLPILYSKTSIANDETGVKTPLKLER